MAFFGKKKQEKVFKYSGIRTIMDGYSAVIMCERESSDAAACLPYSTLSTLWNQEKSSGHLNISNRVLITVAAKNQQAAATMTAGLSLSGLRATCFSGLSENISTMHESLYASVGKRLPFVLNLICTATTKASSTLYCSHDDYHSVADTGAIQFFARNNQSVADLNIIARKVAELSLNPAIVAQDGFLTTHILSTFYLPEQALIKEFLGLPSEMISPPTLSQEILFGKTRRRVLEAWTVDLPVQLGAKQDSDSYMKSVVGQRPYFFDHVNELIDQCMEEWFDLTGRRYDRINQFLCQGADYIIIAQGSIIDIAEIAAHRLRQSQKINVGVINLITFRPFSGDLLSHVIKGKKGVVVLERTDQPLSESLPIISEIRTSISKAFENAYKDESFNGYAAYTKTSDAPSLYSVCFGLGGHKTSVEDIMSAVNNMLPSGEQHKFSYLGVKFTEKEGLSPQQEIYQQVVTEAYPLLDELSLSHNNMTQTDDNIQTTRIHSTGGFNDDLFLQNVAECLLKEFNFEVKASLHQGIERKGQPTILHLTTSLKPFQLNTIYNTINSVIVIDSTAFSHSTPLQGLVEGGVLILQHTATKAIDVWQSLPIDAQKILLEKNITIFFIDGFKISKENTVLDETQLIPSDKNRHLVFQAAFFKATEIGLGDDKTEEQIQAALGENTVLIQHTYRELKAIDLSKMIPPDIIKDKDPLTPLLLVKKPASKSSIADIHRFWHQLDYNSVDPFSSLAVVPAATGIFYDNSPSRTHHLKWQPEKCTGCESCYQTNTDHAIYGLVNTVNEVFETNIKRIEKKGQTVKYLRRAIRTVEKKYHELTENKEAGTDLTPIFAKAIGDTIKEYPEPEKDAVSQEFELFKQAQGNFKFALTPLYHTDMNNKQSRSGGLFSLTINSDSHKGGINCTPPCQAFKLVEQTEGSLQELRDNWDYWLDLPSSNKKFSQIDDLQNKQGILQTLLLDKKNHQSLLSYGNTEVNTSEPIAIHLLTSTITALMQPRIKKHLKQINQLIIDMEKHIRLKLVENLDISDVDALETAIDENKDVDLTLSRLTGALDKEKAIQPIDSSWLKWALNLVTQLKQLKWAYQEGLSGEGRANLGVTDGTHKTSTWTATYPLNPYPFPWVNHLSQHSPSLAIGLFEGHMIKMADGFKAIRIAELEIKGKYDQEQHQLFFAHFDWHQFTEDEYLLCPPLISISAEGESKDAGFQSLSESLLSDMPIKVLVLDNQPQQKMESTSKELSLVAMAHRTAFVHQGSIANISHLLEGYIDGLNYRGPALWSVYTSKQSEAGISNRSLTLQSQLAHESRAYPLLSFDPRLGKSWEECIDLSKNTNLLDDWVSYSFDYTDEYGNNFSKETCLTYADWALTEATLHEHFSIILADKSTDNTVLLTEYLKMGERDQADNKPFIWAVHPQTDHLLKAIVSPAMVKASQYQKEFWHLLKGLGGHNKIEIDTQAITEQAQAEMAKTITEGLMSMMGGDSSALAKILADAPKVTTAIKQKTPSKVAEVPAEKKPTSPKVAEKNSVNIEVKKPTIKAHDPVWIETPDCTTCDECVDIAPSIFQYNEEKKAIIIDPTKGTFEDIVRSAEKCTAVIIHPGTPWNLDEPGLDKLIKRAEKFQ